MAGERNLVGGDALYSYSLPTQISQTPVNVRDTRGVGPASSPPTFIVSHDGFSPPEPGRKRRRYTDDERRQVAAKRKEKACEEHRASKTKCTCVRTNRTTSTTQRYLDGGERHETIALGLISSKEHMKVLERDLERTLAAVNKIPKLKSETRNPKIRSDRGSQSQTPIPSPNEGTYGSFKISSPPALFGPIRPSPKLVPKGIMSPPMSRRPAPHPQDLKSPQIGGVPMARGDSGYSYYSVESAPTLIHSGFAGPPSTQFSPLQNHIPNTPTTVPISRLPRENLASNAPNGLAVPLDSSLPCSNEHGFKNSSGTGAADPILFDTFDDFDFMNYLNDSSFLKDAFPEQSSTWSE